MFYGGWVRVCASCLAEVKCRSVKARAMSKLAVRIVEPSAASRLVPTYKADVGILALESPVPRDWPFGLLVDGCLILDLDADKRIANVDLQIPRSGWTVSDEVRWPNSAPPAGLVVGDQAVKLRGFEDEVLAFTTADGSVVIVTIGDRKPGRWWALSDAVLAATRGDELVGFELVGFAVRLYP